MRVSVVRSLAMGSACRISQRKDGIAHRRCSCHQCGLTHQQRLGQRSRRSCIPRQAITRCRQPSYFTNDDGDRSGRDGNGDASEVGRSTRHSTVDSSHIRSTGSHRSSSGGDGAGKSHPISVRLLCPRRYPSPIHDAPPRGWLSQTRHHSEGCSRNECRQVSCFHCLLH